MTKKSNVPYDTISRLSVTSQSIFNKCCCCIPLRIGCIILGYLHLTVNCIQTIFLVAVTTLVGVVTHGFDHIDSDSMWKSETSDPDDMEDDFITGAGIILGVLLVANLSWMIIHIACLVGLHKKRPGPIRVYVGFATVRFLLTLAAFIYMVMRNVTQSQSIIVQSFDLAVSAYFILVYYIYTVQLEKEQAAEIAQRPFAPSSNDFVYPTKLDKNLLVA